MTPQPSARAPYPLLILFVVLATAIAGLAWRYHLAQKDAVAHEVHKQLLAIAEMKVKQITEWRSQKIGEARIILHNRLLLAALDRRIAGRSPAAETLAVGRWLEAICREMHYAGVILADARGNVVLSHGRTFGDDAHIRSLAAAVLAMSDVDLTDFHLGSGHRGPVHLGLNVPLRIEAGKPAFGVLLIGLDPGDYLFPLLQRWPLPAVSAESLLVRREGDTVVFLTPLRKPTGSSTPLRVPITQTQVAAVRAIIGEEGTLEAVDYRNVPVYAAVQAVPGTGWRLVAKIDAEEVLAPLRWRSGLMGALAISLICFSAAGVFVLWRRHELRWYRARYESELARRRAAEAYDAERRAMDEELRRAVDAAQTSESRFRAAYEQAAVGMNEVSLDGKFLRVNQRYCEIVGYSAEELLRLGFADVTHPDDQAAEAERVAALLRGEQATGRWEKRYIRKNGATIWGTVTASLIRGASGEPHYFLAVVEDITAAVEAKEALRQTEERFRQLVENAPEGIVVVSGAEIRYLNPAAVEMFGADSAAQLIGSPALDRVLPEDRAEARERLAAVLGGSRAPQREHQYVRLNGEAFPVEVSATPIVYDRPASALVFFRDVTARQRADEQRERLEQSLRQAQKMESVGRLAGGVAHDFNNHLTVINGYCDMLLDALGPDDPLREELGEIRAAGDRAAGLTQQLLAFSRKQIVEPRPLSLNEVVEEYCRLVRRLIGDDIEVSTGLDPELGVVMVDRGQMHQILMNLAVNARDAMPNGGKITLTTANVEIEEADAEAGDLKPGRYVALTVIDTGVGMTAETLQNIFEPFFTTKPMGVGTGLGLATVYGIVQQCGGFIRVASLPGQGSSFRIYLPRTSHELRPAASGPAASEGLRGTETVLVVEDQDEVRKLTLGILRKLGYRLLEAADGPEALRVSESFGEPIDLLVTDVVMPGMTGRELATRLGKLRPALRVLFMSGYTGDVIAREGVLDGSVSFLHKPFAPGDLAVKVREALAPVEGPARGSRG